MKEKSKNYNIPQDTEERFLSDTILPLTFAVGGCAPWFKLQHPHTQFKSSAPHLCGNLNERRRFSLIVYRSLMGEAIICLERRYPLENDDVTLSLKRCCGFYRIFWYNSFLWTARKEVLPLSLEVSAMAGLGTLPLARQHLLDRSPKHCQRTAEVKLKVHQEEGARGLLLPGWKRHFASSEGTQRERNLAWELGLGGCSSSQPLRLHQKFQWCGRPDSCACAIERCFSEIKQTPCVSVLSNSKL